MKYVRLLLAGCLLTCLACDDFDFDLDLDTVLLTVAVTTVGQNIDGDGYTLSVTGQADQAIAVNETRIYNVFRIDVTVQLLEVAGNCAVDDNPRTFRVDGPRTVTFVVECS